MVSDLNFLLVGNSRLHWAQYSKNQSKFFHTKKEQKVPENIDLNKLIWASVGKRPNFLLKKENEIKTKDIQLSNLPDYFGVGDWHSSSPDGIETKGRNTRFGGIKQECGIHTNN